MNRNELLIPATVWTNSRNIMLTKTLTPKSTMKESRNKRVKIV
jgi:hypothetical protein